MAYDVIQGFILILLAEMGDKTQMLAMAFATKFSLRKVLFGVFIGSFLNHGLAAILGTYLSDVIPINVISLLAAIAFIGFGIWSLKLEGDGESEGVISSSKFGPVSTVAAAFFMGEMGDKTQLTVITLASQSSYPMFILLGTVGGMVVTSAMGVFVGSKLGKNIPELTLKIVSSTIFILFGLLGLRSTLPTSWMTTLNISMFLFVLTLVMAFMINKLKRTSTVEDTPYKKTAAELYLNTIKIQESLIKLCDESEDCINCNEELCTIRCLNNYLKESQEKEKFIFEEDWNVPICIGAKCNSKNLRESLKETINTCIGCSSHQNNCIGNRTRTTLEILYFGKTIPYTGNRQKYYKEIENMDPQFFN